MKARSPCRSQRVELYADGNRSLALRPGEEARVSSLADLPLDDFHPEKWKTIGGHHARAEFDPDLLKVLVARPRTWSPGARGKAMVRNAWGLEPLRVVHVNLREGRAVRTDQAPQHVLWGDIPTPLF